MNNNEHKNNPMHGVKLVQILEELEAKYGWETLGTFVNIRCFQYDPSVKSCLKFLRKTPWARAKVEELYLLMLKVQEKNSETSD
ncbi:MAG: VF530 family protein [Campylobacterota bacterium]|nr:VF530 family protein [Campylobacterota bacterium]